MDIEKDPFINKLQNDVFDKLAELSKPEPGKEKPLQNDLSIISPEEAIKELIKLQKNQIDSNT